MSGDQIVVLVDSVASDVRLSLDDVAPLVEASRAPGLRREAAVTRTIRTAHGVYRAQAFLLPKGTRLLLVVDEENWLALSNKRRELPPGRARFDAPSEVSLSSRQWQIVREVRLGKSNAQIGEALGISPVTVGAHLTKIYRAFGVRGRSALLARLFDGQDGSARRPRAGRGALARRS